MAFALAALVGFTCNAGLMAESGIRATAAAAFELADEMLTRSGIVYDADPDAEPGR